MRALTALLLSSVWLFSAPAGVRAQTAEDGSTDDPPVATEDGEATPVRLVSFREAGDRGLSVPIGRTDTQSPITDSTRDVVELRGGAIGVTLGMLLSGLADIGFAAPQIDDNGFVVTDARTAFLGELGELWQFLLQLDFVRDRPLLDLRLTFQPFEALRIQAGRFKVPFSGEFVTAAADIDMNFRAQAVNALRPGRSVGVEIGGDVLDRAWFYRAGVFNGNLDFSNDGPDLLVVARTGTELSLGSDDWTWTLAGNVAFSRDTQVRLPFRDAPFTGERLLAGGDARLVLGPVHLATEVIYGRFAPAAEPAFEAFGYHVTAGWLVLPFFQVLFRWDRFFREDIDRASDLLIPSLSFVVPNFPSIQTQLDVIIPVDEADQTRAVLSLTVAF